MPDRTEGSERRRLRRFELAAPAQVVVELESGARACVELTTKNVSSAGAYLYCPRRFREGARVNMELWIAAERISKLAGHDGAARIKVRGAIVRVDMDGIAVRFESNYKMTVLDKSIGESGSL